MILNSKEEKSLGSLLADKGIINAVKCGVCRNLTAFEDEDIVWRGSLLKVNCQKGYIKCPWCGNEMYVGESQETKFGKVLTKQYFSIIEGKDYDKIKYEVKNGRGITQIH